MEIPAKDLFTVVAMVQRLAEELNARAAHTTTLIDLLAAKGILTGQDQDVLHRVLGEQIEIARQTDIAENEPEAPSAQRLPDELSEELDSLGVISQPKTLGETLKTDFHELVERVFKELRREQNHGEGGSGSTAGV
ncbi:MAG TPA: hypothetical protein VJ692_05285 [Nitrospiraceae bacterium]|nr:hypothetical protein [Nitrospiraceae bacterium]